MIVGHNTEAMREWSGNIETSAQEYDQLISSLYSLVDNLVSTEFTGGLSQDFEESVLNKKDDFMRLSQTLNDCAELVKTRSSRIDDDEAELKSQIQSSSMF